MRAAIEFFALLLLSYAVLFFSPNYLSVFEVLGGALVPVMVALIVFGLSLWATKTHLIAYRNGRIAFLLALGFLAYSNFQDDRLAEYSISRQIVG